MTSYLAITVLYSTLHYSTLLYFTLLYCTVLYCNFLYCTLLFIISLYSKEHLTCLLWSLITYLQVFQTSPRLTAVWPWAASFLLQLWSSTWWPAAGSQPGLSWGSCRPWTPPPTGWAHRRCPVCCGSQNLDTIVIKKWRLKTFLSCINEEFFHNIY